MSSTEPLVSIILPVRNAADTLSECLNSIIRQTLGNFEVIAIDDGSTDSSLQILHQFARRDSRFRVIASPHRGLVSALNHSIAVSQCEFLARMDADDIMHPQRIEKQYNYLVSYPETDVIACQVEVLSTEPMTDGLRHYINWQNNCISSADISASIYIESPLTHPSVMFRRSSLLASGLYRQGNFPEDYDLWLRMIHSNRVVRKLNETLLIWRDTDTRLSRNDPRCARDSFDRLRAAHLSRDPRIKQAGRLVVWGAGRRTRKRCQHLLDYGYSPEVWVDIDPKKIGNKVLGKSVVAPDWLTDPRQQKDRPFVLCYVNNHGARELIAQQLDEMGYNRGTGYLMIG